MAGDSESTTYMQGKWAEVRHIAITANIFHAISIASYIYIFGIMMTIHRSFTATQDKGDNRQRVLGMGEYIVRVADIISLRWVNDQVIDESSRTRVRMHLSAKQNTPHTHTHSKWHNNSSNMYTQRASENSVALYLRTLNGRAADTTTIACLCVCWAPAARVRMQPLP